MSKYVFKSTERYAVYKVFDCSCQWCGEPIEYKNTHIDHVIPETLLEKPAELRSVLQSYGLDDSFDINDFENWIPLHPNCNSKKNAAVYKCLPIIKTLLDRCATNKEQARKIKIRLERQPKKSEILIKIEEALGNEIIDKEEIQKFLRAYNVENITNESDPEIQRLISLGVLQVTDEKKWKVVKILSDDQAMVTDGVNTGIIPRSPAPHISWLCTYCLSFGPWDGSRCLSCGAFSVPD